MNCTERNDCYEVVALLSAAGATLSQAWIDADDDRGFPLGEWVRADARMQAALNTSTRAPAPEHP